MYSELVLQGQSQHSLVDEDRMPWEDKARGAGAIDGLH